MFSVKKPNLNNYTAELILLLEEASRDCDIRDKHAFCKTAREILITFNHSGEMTEKVDGVLSEIIKQFESTEYREIVTLARTIRNPICPHHQVKSIQVADFKEISSRPGVSKLGYPGMNKLLFRQLKVLPNGQFLLIKHPEEEKKSDETISCYSEIIIWDPIQNQISGQYQVAALSIASEMVSADQILLCGGGNGDDCSFLFNIKNGKCSKPFNDYAPDSILYKINDNFFARLETDFYNKFLIIYSLEKDEMRKCISISVEDDVSIAVLNKKIYLVLQNGSVRVYQYEENLLKQVNELKLTAKESESHSIVSILDEDKLLLRAGSSISIWQERQNGIEKIREVILPEENLDPVIICSNKNGLFITKNVSNDYSKFILWDAETLNYVRLEFDGSYISSLQFLPDGRLAVIFESLFNVEKGRWRDSTSNLFIYEFESINLAQIKKQVAESTALADDCIKTVMSYFPKFNF